jgi:predicted AlkP superfamily phosphohydrolase/phosphomutase
MAKQLIQKLTRRTFISRTAAAAAIGAAGLGAGGYWMSRRKRPSRTLGKKVIVIGVDGMDPRLSESMMEEGLLPNLAKLREQGGFSRLGTSIPPQSPVAWANFINGAGPGSHGIFDFVHRDPKLQGQTMRDPRLMGEMYYSAAVTTPGGPGWEVGDYRMHLDFWPFNQQPPTTVLMRKGVPFWNHLDAAGIPSTFYDLPSNYPPSPSQHGHHRCICGMGTPDLLGGYGTYQYFSEDGPAETQDDGTGKWSWLIFKNETAQASLVGPMNSFLQQPKPTKAGFLVHRDREANAAVIEVQGQKIILRPGDYSRWTKLEFDLSTPWFVPDENLTGICRFYLQEVAPNFRLYVSPINIDPRSPAIRISEPDSFIQDVAKSLGPFYTTGFQEEYNARKNGFFDDDEYARQAGIVLEERLAMYDYAVDDYEDGLLFFYFSSSDLQSHIFWWDSDEEHPFRSPDEAKKYFGHVRALYQRLDALVGELMQQYGGKATIIMMSDHGFANFGQQFNLNSWLRDWRYLGPPECTSLFRDVDWKQTAAYGLGINGLYLNLKGREPYGTIAPGAEQSALLDQIARGLVAVRDYDGRQVIRDVYRADQIYHGNETTLAPDLIVGYARGFRASWETMLGDLTDDVLLKNENAWSADHCAAAAEVPGVLFCNRAIRPPSTRDDGPALIDIAPSILAEFGLTTPATMEGVNILGT